jgi:hypothetical protein
MREAELDPKVLGKGAAAASSDGLRVIVTGRGPAQPVRRCGHGGAAVDEQPGCGEHPRPEQPVGQQEDVAGPTDAAEDEPPTIGIYS